MGSISESWAPHCPRAPTTLKSFEWRHSSTQTTEKFPRETVYRNNIIPWSKKKKKNSEEVQEKKGKWLMITRRFYVIIIARINQNDRVRSVRMFSGPLKRRDAPAVSANFTQVLTPLIWCCLFIYNYLLVLLGDGEDIKLLTAPARNLRLNYLYLQPFRRCWAPKLILLQLCFTAFLNAVVYIFCGMFSTVAYFWIPGRAFLSGLRIFKGRCL